MTGPVPMKPSIAGSAASAAAIWFCCSVWSASRPTNCGDDLTLERVGEAVAALFERHVRLFLTSAQDLGRTQVVEALTRALAGDELGLADVGEGADLLVVVRAGVERDHRDAGGDCGLQRRDQLVGAGERRGDAVGAFAHGLLDQLHLHAGIVDRLHPHALDPEVFTRGVHAAMDDRPERAALGVADHVEREVGALLGSDRVATGLGGRQCRHAVSAPWQCRHRSRRWQCRQSSAAVAVSVPPVSSVTPVSLRVVVVIAAAGSQDERERGERCKDRTHFPHWVFSPLGSSMEVGAMAAERVEQTRACVACGTRAVEAPNT